MPERYGIALPQSGAAAADLPDSMTAFAARAEQLGFHSLWTQEQTLGVDPSLEPIVNLAYVASATNRIRLGTAAIIAPARNPVLLAKQLASLDRLSGGRTIVGLALGDMPSLYEASGVTDGARGARLDETVHVLKGFWTRERFDHTSRYRRITSAPMEPKPVQGPHPPIWFGGSSEAALSRALREGQGWIGAGGGSFAVFERATRRLREGLRGAKRPFTIAKKVYVAVEDTHERAYDRLVAWFAAHWAGFGDPHELTNTVGVFGTAQEVAEKLSELAAMGPDLITLNPVYNESDQLERLAADVIPAVRAG